MRLLVLLQTRMRPVASDGRECMRDAEIVKDEYGVVEMVYRPPRRLPEGTVAEQLDR